MNTTTLCGLSIALAGSWWSGPAQYAGRWNAFERLSRPQLAQARGVADIHLRQRRHWQRRQSQRRAGRQQKAAPLRPNALRRF